MKQLFFGNENQCLLKVCLRGMVRGKVQSISLQCMMVVEVLMAFAEEQKLEVHWQVEEHCELHELGNKKKKDKINNV